MKKVVFLLAILVVVTGAVFAQSAEGIIAVIPPASYIKSDDSAVWTFAPSGISIVDARGEPGSIATRDMRDLTAVSESGSVGFTFAYDTDKNKRTYRLIVNPMTGVVTITIVLNGKPLAPATLTKR